MIQRRAGDAAPDQRVAPSRATPPEADKASPSTSTLGPREPPRLADDCDHGLPGPAASLLSHAEPLVAISTAHLTPSTRRRLASGTLSVLAYPNEYGGFVYVGPAGENIPLEPELATIFAIAVRAAVVWIKFDADAAPVPGLPVFGDSP